MLPFVDQQNDREAQCITIVQLVASVIGEKAYAEYELKDLTEELIDKYNEITLIYEISEALGAVLDPKRVCEIILFWIYVNA